MYKREFDKVQKEFKSYLFWGDEPYFIEKYATNTANRLCPKESRLTLYYDEFDYTLAKEYLGQSSLFGDTNLLVIRHEKALPKKEIESLIDICKKTPNSYLIYLLPSSAQGKKLASIFSAKKEAVDVRFFKASMSEAKMELGSYIKEIGLELEPYALEHLLTLLEGDLLLAKKEIEKLASLDRPVDVKEIDTLVNPLNPLNLEKLYIAIVKKEPIDELLKKIMDEEQNEMKILLGLQNYIQQLFLFYSYIRLHGSSDSKAILGYKLPAKIEEERVALCIKIKNYPKIFQMLQECEYLLKTKTSIDKESLLFSYLIKLQGLF